jgi:hypothetical protein
MSGHGLTERGWTVFFLFAQSTACVPGPGTFSGRGDVDLHVALVDRIVASEKTRKKRAAREQNLN